MIVELTIEVVDVNKAYEVNNTLYEDYNLNLFDFSFPSKNICDNTEKLFLVIKEENLFLDIINAIKTVFIFHNINIYNINLNFTHKLIQELIINNNLNNFFSEVDLSIFTEKEILSIVEKNMTTDDILDKINKNKMVTSRDKELIQLKN